MFKFIERWMNLDWYFMTTYPQYAQEDWNFVRGTFIFLILLVIASSILWLYPMAKKCWILQKFYCKIGVHCPKKDYIFNYFDGAVDHCTCKWCGKKGYLYEDRKFIPEEDDNG